MTDYSSDPNVQKMKALADAMGIDFDPVTATFPDDDTPKMESEIGSTEPLVTETEDPLIKGLHRNPRGFDSLGL